MESLVLLVYILPQKIATMLPKRYFKLPSELLHDIIFLGNLCLPFHIPELTPVYIVLGSSLMK